MQVSQSYLMTLSLMF